MGKAKKYGIPSTGFSNRDADRRRGQKGFFHRKGVADNRLPRSEREYEKSRLDEECEKLSKQVEEIRSWQNADSVYVHGAMKYQCQNCGISWWMFLEKGLEEPGEDHKPVPFIIGCPVCGGPAMDISGICKLPVDYEKLPYGESYFKNYPSSGCGVPVIGDRFQSVIQMLGGIVHGTEQPTD